MALRRWATIALQAGCTAEELAALVTDASLALPVADFVNQVIAAVEGGSRGSRR
jgi:hypothetical protein